MRTHVIACRSCLVVLPVVLALAALPPAPAAQLEREAEVARPRHQLTGRVLMPDGSAAAGAVVVTSAGGQAVAGADGGFTLAVNVPLGVESLEVTAVADDATGSGSLVANVRIAPAARARTVTVGKLVLSESLACHPRWLPTFGGAPGWAAGGPAALAVFDDGGGPALYAGGGFDSMYGVPASQIARWDGTSWSALGSGLNAWVGAVTVYDDGGGPALYAGGSFTIAGEVVANGIARWDGTSWSALGSGMASGPNVPGPYVSALAVFDDGGGPALYAGGSFTSCGGVAANYIAKWDGTSWSALGSGMSGGGQSGTWVGALASFDDGGGPALYAGGRFTIAGGVAANRIARWDGTSWSALDSGIESSFGEVRALTVFDPGSGPGLYAAGRFLVAGGVPANHVARWDGTSWSALGSGPDGEVEELAVYDPGSGPELYASGYFATAGGVPALGIARWDGSAWSSVDNGFPPPLQVGPLTTFDDGSGARLVFGRGSRIAMWDGASWSEPPACGMNNRVQALTVHDEGGGPALYAAGSFSQAGCIAASCVARWDGASWSALGSGVNDEVVALHTYDDGSGPALFAGGRFANAGGVSASRIAKWNGVSWSRLRGGTSDVVRALTVFDDGGGPVLCVGGDFTTAGGASASRIATWDGARWSALGSGLDGPVRSLAVHDDGSGLALYAGGDFSTAGGVPANRIARWDGTSWSALDAGLTGPFGSYVKALTLFDDGSGAALYAAGYFANAGAVLARNVARWDGSSWSALGRLGDAAHDVHALVVHDDGRGPALHGGGFFFKQLARWNGSSWEDLGSGLTDYVQALASWDDGSGPALYAGGAFSGSASGDSFLARRGCRAKVRKGGF